ncbi:hypothetical protein BC829DRAFT_380065 [Chytridium lagenaria]|nr:hypothetical protein BC829DRAFT_380065 [Chytridium lagenaria]
MHEMEDFILKLAMRVEDEDENDKVWEMVDGVGVDKIGRILYKLVWMGRGFDVKLGEWLAQHIDNTHVIFKRIRQVIGTDGWRQDKMVLGGMRGGEMRGDGEGWLMVMHGVVKVWRDWEKVREGGGMEFEEDLGGLMRSVGGMVGRICEAIYRGERTVTRRGLHLLQDLIPFLNGPQRAVLVKGIQPLVNRTINDPTFSLFWEKWTSDGYCEFWGDDGGWDEEMCMGLDREGLRSLVDVVMSLLGMEVGEGLEVGVRELDKRLAVLLTVDDLPIRAYDLHADNDAALVTFMHKFTKLYQCGRTGLPTLTAVLKQFNPHHVFLWFLYKTGFDASVLLDLLIGNETIFLEFFIGFLRWTCDSGPALFVDATRWMDTKDDGEVSFGIVKTQHDKGEAERGVMRMMMELVERIEGIHRRRLFPFKPDALIRRLKMYMEVIERD